MTPLGSWFQRRAISRSMMPIAILAIFSSPGTGRATRQPTVRAARSTTLPPCPKREWAAYLDACVSLLPLAAGCFDDSPQYETATRSGNATFQDIVAFLDQTLSNSEFTLGSRSPPILAPTCRNQPIGVVANRWGFADISGFNRALRHFGCSPHRFRMRFGG
jgi:AraC-like DNA-binding protein